MRSFDVRIFAVVRTRIQGKIPRHANVSIHVFPHLLFILALRKKMRV